MVLLRQWSSRNWSFPGDPMLGEGRGWSWLAARGWTHLPGTDFIVDNLSDDIARKPTLLGLPEHRFDSKDLSNFSEWNYRCHYARVLPPPPSFVFSNICNFFYFLRVQYNYVIPSFSFLLPNSHIYPYLPYFKSHGSFFMNCCYMHICVTYMHLSILYLNTNCLVCSSYVTCMYTFFRDDHVALDIQSMCFPGEALSISLWRVED